ncbi:hypothetical protein [Streptomyces violascens]|uniref:hypothetical protein n=1 Tax=Streptomyces violascens TaxID=67381 RepID=UPI001676DD05|nr:hypothetical protein [Streptomyces violascens]GGU41378.1 hypothetical protein GCM10010289_72870 [Streptomyces violascens]
MKSRRIVWVAAGVVALGGVYAFGWWSGQPVYDCPPPIPRRYANYLAADTCPVVPRIATWWS